MIEFHRRIVNVPDCAAALLLGLLLWVSGTSAVRADTDQLNGNWVLDAEESESYQSAVKIVKAQILKIHKREKKERFGGSTHGSGNKFYEQEDNAKELMAEDTVDVDWGLPTALQTVMEATTIKIYQSRMCAVLYDKKFKRLFGINPDGNSYSVKGTEFARDEVGRTFGYFEGQTLVIDTDIKGGDRLLERLSLNDSGDQLTIVYRYRRSDLGRTLEYKRIFKHGE